MYQNNLKHILRPNMHAMFDIICVCVSFGFGFNEGRNQRTFSLYHLDIFGETRNHYYRLEFCVCVAQYSIAQKSHIIQRSHRQPKSPNQQSLNADGSSRKRQQWDEKQGATEWKHLESQEFIYIRFAMAYTWIDLFAECRIVWWIYELLQLFCGKVFLFYFHLVQTLAFDWILAALKKKCVDDVQFLTPTNPIQSNSLSFSLPLFGFFSISLCFKSFFTYFNASNSDIRW